MKKVQRVFSYVITAGHLSYGKYGSWKECNRCNSRE